MSFHDPVRFASGMAQVVDDSWAFRISASTGRHRCLPIPRLNPFVAPTDACAHSQLFCSKADALNRRFESNADMAAGVIIENRRNGSMAAGILLNLLQVGAIAARSTTRIKPRFPKFGV